MPLDAGESRAFRSKRFAMLWSRSPAPPKGRTRWSVRSMARAAGISRHGVHQIWKRNDLKPHVSHTFKHSNDPHFEEKFWDFIVLYLNPSEKTLVLYCNEKSQCQALERSQPELPGMGHVKTKNHNHIRHGTVTLFAVLNCLEGKIIARTESVHTQPGGCAFSNKLIVGHPPISTFISSLTTTAPTNIPR